MKRGVHDEATLEEVLDLAESMLISDSFDTWREEYTDERILQDIEEAYGYQTMHDWEREILDYASSHKLYLYEWYWEILNEEDPDDADLYLHKDVEPIWRWLNSGLRPRMRFQMNSSYEQASCLNCATSDVRVPEDFVRSQDEAFDLVNIVQNELWDRGLAALIKQLYRPKADTFRFSFVITDPTVTDEQVDAAIEGIVENVVRSGFNPEVSVDSQLSFDSGQVPGGRYYEPGWEDADEYAEDEELIQTDDRPLRDEEFTDSSVDPFDEEEHPEDSLAEEDIFAADDPDDSTDTQNYLGYTVTGSPKLGYVCLSPYGKWAPEVFKTKLEALEAIKQDFYARFGTK